MKTRKGLASLAFAVALGSAVLSSLVAFGQSRDTRDESLKTAIGASTDVVEGQATDAQTKKNPALPDAPEAHGIEDARTFKTPPNSLPRSKWPSPVADSQIYSYALFDLLEYQRLRGNINAFRWSLLGWRGGDIQRFWFKSEGEQYSSSKVGGEADVQALYGKAISPYFDLQGGLRYEEHFEEKNVGRVFAVLALQGLAPYRFDLEPELFLSNKGKFSGRVTTSIDLLMTQRLVLQPRVETNFAFQRDTPFGVDPGINDVDTGLRLRYEVRREFAPYVGISFRQGFGATSARTVREGGISNELQFIFGVRAWH
jgi:copper resistance protein B